MLVSTSFARADAIFGDELEQGAFGGPEVRLSPVHEDLGVFLGASGGWILDHRWILGGAGYALVNKLGVADQEGANHDLSLGYGGVVLAYADDAERVGHLVGGVLIGGGGADLGQGELFFDLEDTGDSFFVLEPSLGLEINVRENVHLKLEGGYRWIRGVDLPRLTDSDLSGASFGLGVRVGQF